LSRTATLRSTCNAPVKSGEKKGKINVKAVTVHAMKTYGQVEELLHLFLTLALLGYQRSTSHLGSFICDKRTPQPVWMFW